MNTRTVFGIICILFFIFGGLVSIILHNGWHALAVYGAGVAGVILLWGEIRKMRGGPYQ